MKNVFRLFFLLLAGASCSEEEEKSNSLSGAYAEVDSVSVSDVTSSAATLKATVLSNGGSAIIEKGFCWSSARENPDKNDSSMSVYDATPYFERKISGLAANTTYYARAFAVNSAGIAHSSATRFTTTAAAPDDGEDDLLAKFTAPTYADDYSSISSWDRRSSWNLANIHDPTVEKCGDYYYMYGTDASYGNVHAGHGHYPCRRSKDLVSWEFLGMAMTTTPSWVKDTLNNIRQRLGLAPISNPIYGHWAPVVRKAGDKYRMYYSIPIDNYIASGLPNTTANFDGSWTERAFIGLMEATDLASSNWEDKGMVVCSSTDRGLSWSRPNLNNWSAYFKWNAIDPSFLIDKEEKHWLIYGSWHSGIVALELNPQTGKPNQLENEPDDYGTRIARRENRDANRWQGQEAPEIIYNPETDYYYLFLAYDELSVAYNTRVCRSRNITGPYLGYNGANITQGADCFPILTHPYRFKEHSGWVGISHCCIFQNPNTGKWFYASQGRLPENTNGNPYSNAIMMGHVRAIRWTDDGWPVVMPERYAGVPQTAITEEELIGTWENIFLNYSYRQQQTSSSIALTSDKKVSGAISGSWSYDASSGTLTLGQYRLYLQRELDWEANPRVPTIVYAGLTSQGVSIWGKKNK
jgi:arabinan endo-1,5-alpha-L-arabinosidase